MAESRSGGWRLRSARSAYVRSAAESAIDWFPWGTEPFELAERTRRPVLLDIGAAWCHWCHVMDEGTYSDAEVARLINQHFVAVKVDRDEHPEVDRRFQRQVVAITGESGWPLTAFVTPEGAAFLGGTYFPPTDGLGRPGFRRVLKEVARLWRESPERIRENTRQIGEAIAQAERPEAVSLETRPFLEGVRSHLAGSFDPVYGGFGHAPKFPHPTAISFLLWDAAFGGVAAAADRARQTLRAMADGGMYDHVGGGFHRYSVDEGWRIPHFEKMAIDNAALLSAYVEGASWFREPRFAETVKGTLGWLFAVLRDPAGGFGASQDADNAPGDDGGYFTWSRAELREVLDPTGLRLVSRFFGVGSEGRMPDDPERNVLFRLMSVEEAAEGTGLAPDAARQRLEEAIARLRAARERRPRPAVDGALYASLNGLLVRALVGAHRILGEEEALVEARKAADRFLSHAYAPETGVAHRLEGEGGRGLGLLDDQVGFALGLVELAGATLDPRYVRAADEILSLILREFRSESGILVDLAPGLYDGPKIGRFAEPAFPIEDQPHLSPNAGAALAMARLASLTNEARWEEAARSLVRSLQSRLGHAGLFAAGTALAAGILSIAPTRVVIEGEGEGAEALYRASVSAWHPNLWVFRGVPPAPFSVPSELASAGGAARAPRALVCFGTRCLPPVTDPAKVPALLRRGGAEGS